MAPHTITHCINDDTSVIPTRVVSLA